jgi:hypothetical protein
MRLAARLERNKADYDAHFSLAEIQRYAQLPGCAKYTSKNSLPSCSDVAFSARCFLIIGES